MANKRKEQDFVDSLYTNYKSKLNFFAHYVRKNPDVGFNYTINGQNYSFFLESKVYNKENKANYSKQLMAEILINRKLNKSNFKTTGKISYGILLQYNNKQLDGIYEAIKNYYAIDDWNLFGTMYDCEYVFLYDKTNIKLYYCEWKNFLLKNLLKIKVI